MQLKKYPISFLGDKSKKFHSKRTIRYFSPEVFDEQDDINICGYTDLRISKKRNKRKEPIGILTDGKDEISYIYKQRSKISSIIGYIKIKNTENSYVAITSHSAALWVVILLLFLLILLLFSFCNKDSNHNNPLFNPTIEQNIDGDESQSENKKASGIQVKGFTTWSIPANTNNNLSITLENPEGNPCYFSFEIVLSDTGEVIYSSDMVPPGEKISKVNLTHGFDSGEYPATINIKTNELTTGKEMNSPAIQIIIHVS
mgnify:CR=1 FL=1